MNKWVVYTDGSCKGNKNGGIGIVWLKNGEKVFEYSKGYKNTTNNQMELLAIGVALKSFKKSIDSLEIVSDSEYALGCIFNDSWNPKKNIELIAKIKKLLSNLSFPITSRHVDGHQKGGDDDIRWNNYVDKLAQTAANGVL